MIICRKNVSRLLVLALALFFIGSMNLFSVAVDSDNDDDTPPVNVEFSVLPAASEPSHEAPARQHSVASVQPSAMTSVQRSVPMSNSELKELTIPFSVPLRC
jgi:hypothetical protein